MPPTPISSCISYLPSSRLPIYLSKISLPKSIYNRSGYIIITAVSFCKVNKLIDKSVTTIFMANFHHIACCNTVRKSVGTNKKKISIDKVCFYVIQPHIRLYAECSCNKILVWVILSLLISKLASPNHFLNNRMVFGKLFDFSAANCVSTAVTDMNDVNCRVFYKHKFTCSSHPCKFRVMCGKFKNLYVSICNNFNHKFRNLLFGHILFI